MNKKVFLMIPKKSRKEVKDMRVIENHYCNQCGHFNHESNQMEVGKDYQGPAHPATGDPKSDERVVEELLCLCTKTDNRLIKNLGTELMEKEFEMVSEKAKEIKELYDGNYIPILNELFDDYMARLDLEIPVWCPLKQ